MLLNLKQKSTHILHIFHEMEFQESSVLYFRLKNFQSYLLVEKLLIKL